MSILDLADFQTPRNLIPRSLGRRWEDNLGNGKKERSWYVSSKWMVFKSKVSVRKEVQIQNCQMVFNSFSANRNFFLNYFTVSKFSMTLFLLPCCLLCVHGLFLFGFGFWFCFFFFFALVFLFLIRLLSCKKF